MMMPDYGITAVKVARSVISHEVTGRPMLCTEALHNEPSGVFVTINTYPDLHLRGCIGFPEPAYPLSEALEHSARSACHDPRFQDLKEHELNDIVVEVTILTPPEPIAVKNKDELLNAVEIGKHGLIMEYRGRKAVFLPQVPAEWGWNVKEYLENLCRKAGIPKDKWKEDDCRILSFEGRVFREMSPNGDVVEVRE